MTSYYYFNVFLVLEKKNFESIISIISVFEINQKENLLMNLFIICLK